MCSLSFVVPPAPFLCRILSLGRPLSCLSFPCFCFVTPLSACVRQALPKILNVGILLGAHTLLFGVMGFALFAGVTGPGHCSTTRDSTPPRCSTFTEHCSDYFSTLQDSFMQCSYARSASSLLQCLARREGRQCCLWNTMSSRKGCAHMPHICTQSIKQGHDFVQNGVRCGILRACCAVFILATGANFPDIMLPVYECSRWNILFFAVFVIIGTYFILNLTLAVAYSEFKDLTLKKVRSRPFSYLSIYVSFIRPSFSHMSSVSFHFHHLCPPTFPPLVTRLTVGFYFTLFRARLHVLISCLLSDPEPVWLHAGRL